MRNHPLERGNRLLALLLLLALGWIPVASSDEFDHVGTLRLPTAQVWGARKWTATELAAFRGRPETATDSEIANFINVAYDRYISHYDLRKFSPKWVAYVTDRASENRAGQNSRPGSDARFKRPGSFFTDGEVADAAAFLDIGPVIDADFSDCVPVGLTGIDVIPKTLSPQEARGKPAYIQRGHLAPDQAMKYWSTTTKGRKAQLESYSLANVVPQMARHNSPTWSDLEEKCMKWAKDLGSVCVIVGPIYNNPANPRRIQKRLTDVVQGIPCADSLFCVVIGKRGGQTAAVGFVMPHTTTAYSFTDKAVTIDAIEQATGIDFMPLLNEPNPLEEAIDSRWLNN